MCERARLQHRRLLRGSEVGHATRRSVQIGTLPAPRTRVESMPRLHITSSRVLRGARREILVSRRVLDSLERGGRAGHGERARIVNVGAVHRRLRALRHLRPAVAHLARRARQRTKDLRAVVPPRESEDRVRPARGAHVRHVHALLGRLRVAEHGQATHPRRQVEARVALWAREHGTRVGEARGIPELEQRRIGPPVGRHPAGVGGIRGREVRQRGRDRAVWRDSEGRGGARGEAAIVLAIGVAGACRALGIAEEPEHAPLIRRDQE
mmetsp:Transcript_36930/g.108196  ORF Transcript_36930/g.108196 Transcript_36930/m.108196 type:complete len:267 (+) Transcript_36930:615-1415(+)|eukprot:2584233-Prymnesium_polylepis.1